MTVGRLRRSIGTFWRDVQERAGKSLSSGVFTYWFENELGVSHLSLPARTACYGAGMAITSVGTSLASRWLRKPESGQRTASLVKEVDYVR